jgi:hypothetical protein
LSLSNFDDLTFDAATLSQLFGFLLFFLVGLSQLRSQSTSSTAESFCQSRFDASAIRLTGLKAKKEMLEKTNISF